MTNAQWKSGTPVKLAGGRLKMAVVGHDSVGSVICEWSQGDHLVRGYVTPTVLVLTDDAEAAENVYD